MATPTGSTPPVQPTFWDTISAKAKAGAIEFIHIASENKNDTTQLGRLAEITASLQESSRAGAVKSQIDAVCIIDDVHYFVNEGYKDDLKDRKLNFAARSAFTVADFGTTYLWLKDLGFSVSNSITDAIGNSRFTSGVTLVGVVTGFAGIGFGFSALDALKRAYENKGWNSQDGVKALLDLAANTAAVARPILALFIVSSTALTGLAIVAAGFGIISFTYGLYIPKADQQEKTLSPIGDAIDTADRLATRTEGFEKGSKFVKASIGLLSFWHTSPALDNLGKAIKTSNETTEVLGGLDRANEFIVAKDFFKGRPWKFANRAFIAGVNAIDTLQLLKLLEFAADAKYFNIPLLTLTKSALGVTASVFGAIDSKLTLDKPSAEIEKVNKKIGKWETVAAGVKAGTSKLDDWTESSGEVVANPLRAELERKRQKKADKIQDTGKKTKFLAIGLGDLPALKAQAWKERKVIAERNALVSSNGAQLTGLNELSRIAVISAATYSAAIQNPLNLAVGVLAFVNAGLGISKYLYSEKNPKKPLVAAAA